MTALELLQRGGLMMWPILLCSLATVYIIVERILFYRTLHSEPEPFLLKVRSIYHYGDVEGVISYCDQKRSVIGEIVKRGMQYHDQGQARIREAVDEAIDHQTLALEKGLTLLAVISALAPLLGFLGAVFGLIDISRALQHSSSLALLNAVGLGIWKAAVSSGAGICVGMIALVGHKLLIAWSRRVSSGLRMLKTDLLRILTPGPIIEKVEPARAPQAANGAGILAQTEGTLVTKH